MERYIKENNVAPSNVFVYRDGASFGQIRVIHEFEIPQIKQALGGIGAKLTFIMVNKRCNARLYQASQQGNGGFKNPPVGTVVDSTITKDNKYKTKYYFY